MADPTDRSKAKAFRGIRGRVAKRLAVAWVLLSLLVGGTVAYLEFRRADEIAFGLAASVVDSLRQHVAQSGAPHVASLNAALEPLVRQGYVQARVVDAAGNAIATAAAIGQPEFFLDHLPEWRSAPATFITGNHRVLWRDNELVVLVKMPLQDQSGRLIGYFNGAYRVDPATRESVRRDFVNNLSAALLAVLATTFVLYPVIMSLNKGVLKLSAELMRSNVELMEVLGSAIAKRDSDTDLHNYRVCLYSIRFAEALGLDDNTIRIVIAGAFLHDVGKIGISDSILLKPGKLTEEEFSVMKTHVQLGVDIVAKSSWLNGAREVIEFHHERFDGSGYRQGLRGESIPLAARLFAIVDVFDALTSRRPYKEAFSLESAIRILAEGRGSHFDPDLLDVFDHIAPELHGELAGLGEAALRSRLHQQVGKYLFDGREYRERAHIAFVVATDYS